MSTRKLFNEILLQIINTLAIGLGGKPESILTTTKKSAALRLGDTSLVEITSSDIFVLGDSSFGANIIPSEFRQTGRGIDPKKFSDFIRKLSPSLVRLNHFGISYKVRDINTEIEKIKKLVTNHSGIHLYEEASQTIGQRWLFLGNRKSWEDPMLEIVLSQSTRTHDLWNPHFQIDLDTNLPIKDLDGLINKTLGREFISWELDIPNIGVVLAMGILGDVNGTKIALSLGTSQRNTQYLRTKILKEIV